MQTQVFIVGRADADQTVAAFLRARLNLPWSKAKQLVESGRVRVAGQPTTDPAQRLKLGKKVELREADVGERTPERSQRRKSLGSTGGSRTSGKGGTAESDPKPAYDGPMPTIVYSDDAIVVIDKPAGLTTMRHADEADEFGERGKHYLPTTAADLLPAMLGRPGVKVRAVHRIDKETTGLVVFARSAVAESALTEQFKNHTIERRYLAVVRGNCRSQTIQSTLVRDRGDGRRGSGDGPTGQRAVTHVSLRETLGECSLVECRLETGRTHQVRIHLGENGTPLCGERVYDRPVNGTPPSDASGAKRPMLHAVRLVITHPLTDERLGWDSPIPADMKSLVARLRERPTTG